jgi:hypothetical protein
MAARRADAARGLELIANDIDPVILSVHDEIDLKSPHSGVDHASVGIALAKSDRPS